MRAKKTDRASRNETQQSRAESCWEKGLQRGARDQARVRDRVREATASTDTAASTPCVLEALRLPAEALRWYAEALRVPDAGVPAAEP
jgi:hypothetical protein